MIPTFYPEEKTESENKTQYLICLQSKCQALLLVSENSRIKVNLPNPYLGTQIWEGARGQHEGHSKIIPASVGPDTPVG